MLPIVCDYKNKNMECTAYICYHISNYCIVIVVIFPSFFSLISASILLFVWEPVTVLSCSKSCQADRQLLATCQN